jgi:hypothetical protein
VQQEVVEGVGRCDEDHLWREEGMSVHGWCRGGG